MNLNLFEKTEIPKTTSSEPLAVRMRPQTLDEFVGQTHIIGPEKLLRRAIETNRLFSSIILWGPPGTGKTTLANLIAKTTKAHFELISAVSAGVADIRQVITRAQQYASWNKKTIVLIDEIHRFNKAQQDALLPHVEIGTIILIGATTENPYFEVIPALVSRSRIFSLKPLKQEELLTLLNRAILDKERGLGEKNISITDQAINHIVHLANGDARSALNALELAIESTTPDTTGTITITLTIAEEAMQQRALLYDKSGDEHYDTISAFIKSVRGSDPDAAVYWLAKMIYAGEDPKFIMRRLLILASEDIGLADPLGIVVASSCARALEWCGLPEAQYHLAEATLYLATAPKSNSAQAYFDALDFVKKEGKVQVPNHLKDATLDKAREGHGKGYKYPHAFPEHWVEQQYLPDELIGVRFYEPTDQGYEKKIIERIRIRKKT